MKKVLVTGAAGFIGFHTALRLIRDGYYVVGIDNMNDYYDVSLKQKRLNLLSDFDGFVFHEMDIEDRDEMNHMSSYGFDYVIHLAAQAGVRYSIENPRAYLESNVLGFMNVLDLSHTCSVEHLVYASSSSVYGGNEKVPFSEDDQVDHPVSMYAATKKADELMAHVYSKLYGLPTTGLRFFTVYGPYGRPDMAYFKFAEKMLIDEPIQVYGHGELSRDFTYIDDIVEGIMRILEHIPLHEVPYDIYNIGYGKPVGLLRFIELLEVSMGMKAKKDLVDMQDGDVVTTYADVSKLKAAVGYQPIMPFEEGIWRFVKWFKDYKGGLS